jgi:hypothetical protein
MVSRFGFEERQLVELTDAMSDDAVPLAELLGLASNFFVEATADDLALAVSQARALDQWSCGVDLFGTNRDIPVRLV